MALWKPEYSTVAAERRAMFWHTRIRCDLHVASLAPGVVEAILRKLADRFQVRPERDLYRTPTLTVRSD